MENKVEKLLSEIQLKLKAPKGQFNAFGKYKYRSCEDVLEAVKPLLGEAILLISDKIVHFPSSSQPQLIELVDSKGNKCTEIVGGDRFYVEATATLKIGLEKISTTASARESENKKGMDDSQITGAASSYARKYALNGLLLIDDNKDADTQDNTKTKTETKPAYKKPEIVQEPQQTQKAEPTQTKQYPSVKDTDVRLISEPQRIRYKTIGSKAGWKPEEMQELIKTFGYEHSKDIERKNYEKICEMLEKGVADIPHGDNKQSDLLEKIKSDSDEKVNEWELDALDKKAIEYKLELNKLTGDDMEYSGILAEYGISQPYDLKNKEEKAKLVTELANQVTESKKGD